MRDKGSTPAGLQVGTKESLGAEATAQEVAYDPKRFFESFYTANVKGEPTDRNTIGTITDPESRFHYNVVENSIIRVISRREPPPAGRLVESWRFIQQRGDRSLLDIGSGTGHWIDFFREVYYIKQVVAVEITPSMATFLRQKYEGDDGVAVLESDFAEQGFDATTGPFDFISAIGVMFHVVDDGRWQQALSNLSQCLAEDGLLFVGGDFGAETQNTEFHKTDDFSTWKEHGATSVENAVRVNKRCRSLADWHVGANEAGLVIHDLVRSDRDPGIMTAENDLLVLKRRLSPSR